MYITIIELVFRFARGKYVFTGFTFTDDEHVHVMLSISVTWYCPESLEARMVCVCVCARVAFLGQ